MTRRLTLLLGLVLAGSLALVPAVSAHSNHHRPLPSTIALPDGFQPEGITSAGHRLFVGSLVDGAIWKGNAWTGHGQVIIPGVEGQMAVGIHLDWRGRLWVAGGSDKTIRVYNPRNGELLRTYSFPTAGFINDLVITPWGVYGTDSFNAQLFVVPLRPFGGLTAVDKAKVLPITGDLTTQPGFNSNGIVRHGRWLIVVQTNAELLFRVNPRTGASQMIDLHGYSTDGDGLLIRGRHLYVVQGAKDQVAVVKLNRKLTDGRYIGRITKPSLDVPSTGTFASGRLYVVNARFGVADPTTAEYWISRLPTWPNRH